MEEIIRTLVERSTIGIVKLDGHGRFALVNEAFAGMVGRTRDEVQALSFNDVTHPDDRAMCVRAFEDIVSGRVDHFEVEKRLVRPDGSTVWAHTVVTAAGPAGSARSMICMTADISRRKEAELEAHSYRQAVLAAQLESSPDGILLVDAEGRIVTHNHRFVEMWGIPPEVVAERSDDKAIASVLSKLKDPEGFTALIKYLYDHRDERRVDELALIDGRVFERSTSPVLDRNGEYHGRVWHFHDVSERVRRERELREKTEELSVSNAGLAVFAYAASHDLHAPLRKIINFGDLLRGRVKDKLDAEELDYLERIRGAAMGASQLVTDLLTLSQVTHDEHPPEAVDLSALLLEVKQDLTAEIAAAGARIDSGPLPVLNAQFVLVRSLLFNLVANAVKFRAKDRPPVVRVDSRRDGDWVVLTVADNGIGFDQGYAEKVFQPFLRLNLSTAFKGSGIGLTICRRVVQRYGGTLTVESEEGRGTTFTARLPASMLARP